MRIAAPPGKWLGKGKDSRSCGRDWKKRGLGGLGGSVKGRERWTPKTRTGEGPKKRRGQVTYKMSCTRCRSQPALIVLDRRFLAFECLVFFFK